MSQGILPRARRASRATKLHDENTVTANVNRLSKDKNTIALVPKPGSVTINGGRKALTDLSNALKSGVTGDRTSKDSVSLKPSRSRPTSSSSLQSFTVTNEIRITSKSTEPHRPALATKHSTQSLREVDIVAPALSVSNRHRSQSEDGIIHLPRNALSAGLKAPYIGFHEQESMPEEEVEILNSSGEGVGLGIQMESKHAEPTSEMIIENSPLPSMDDSQGEYSFSAKSSTEATPAGDAEMEMDSADWLTVDPATHAEARAQIERIRVEFEQELDFEDSKMVAEYSEEIFAYMANLERQAMPNPCYMEYQHDIDWPMRATLIDWLLQIHMRYHMLPETLWITVNIIDRFLSNRVISLVKLQLVGVTAMFVAAKYEEIMAPSVEEFVYMTENGYTRDEILKGERILLQTLDFNISAYCNPYTWVRRISKADNYDIQTRTLSKFLMEVTLLDYRFLRAKPSMIAAVGMFGSRKILNKDWDTAFQFYSGFTEAELLLPFRYIIETLLLPDMEEKFLYKKYANKKFLKASIYARAWAKQGFEGLL